MLALTRALLMWRDEGGLLARVIYACSTFTLAAAGSVVVPDDAITAWCPSPVQSVCAL